jgi:hypothetical protein
MWNSCTPMEKKVLLGVIINMGLNMGYCPGAWLNTISIMPLYGKNLCYYFRTCVLFMMKGQADCGPLRGGRGGEDFFTQPVVKKIYTKLQCIPSFIPKARGPYTASGRQECRWLGNVARRFSLEEHKWSCCELMGYWKLSMCTGIKLRCYVAVLHNTHIYEITKSVPVSMKHMLQWPY